MPRLIDADALMLKIAEEKDSIECSDSYGIGYNNGLAMAYATVIAAPTIDPSSLRQGGEWVVENEHSIRCSECCFNRASIKIPMDFCPNCGTAMRGNKNGC